MTARTLSLFPQFCCRTTESVSAFLNDRIPTPIGLGRLRNISGGFALIALHSHGQSVQRVWIVPGVPGTPYLTPSLGLGSCASAVWDFLRVVAWVRAFAV